MCIAINLIATCMHKSSLFARPEHKQKLEIKEV